MKHPPEISTALSIVGPSRSTPMSVRVSFFGLSLALYVAFALLIPVDPFFSLINYVIAATALTGIFLFDRSSNSLQQVFFLCCLIFFALSPRIEMNTQTTYWAGSASVFQYYPNAAILALIGMCFFALAFPFGKQTRFVFGERKTPNYNPPSISEVRLILLSGLVVGLIYYINNFQLINVFFRGAAIGGSVVELPSYIDLVYTNSLRALPSLCFVVYMLFGARRKWVALILLLLMLLGNPITGFPRWQGAMLYLAALLATFRPLLYAPYFVTAALFTGLFLVFPLLDTFRRFSENLSFRLSLDWIYAGHLDSFQNFARVVELEIVTYGKQLIGVIFFWVPRIIWPDKPAQSGHAISEAGNFGFDNIAMNYLGEGYMNFGAVGVILFAIVLGFFCGQLDRAFWMDQRFSRSFQTFYLLFLGGIVFVFRGSLLSAFAYLVGTYVAVLLVIWLAGASRLKFRFLRLRQ